MSPERAPGIARREFLRRTALGGLGVGLWPLAAGAAPAPAVQRYVRLGRTELRISDIGFGSSSLRGDTRVVQHALERGINYFDTAEGYEDGISEQTIGRALEGRRDEVILASKVWARADADRQRLMRALEGSLRRLRTDRIDVYFNHAVNDLDRLQNEEWGEFVERAKAQGKIRFTGMSGHGPRLIECLRYANQNDLVDVVLVAYNFAQDPTFYQQLKSRVKLALKGFDIVAEMQKLPAAIAQLKARDVGVVCMKTLRGARENDMRPYEGGGATFAQAAFRWVLSNPDVDALIVTMRNPASVDEYLGGSGWNAPRVGDVDLLERYEAVAGAEQCRSACSACAGACPAGVPIPDVLRMRMYAEDYGDPTKARAEWAGLERDAAACLTCAERPCLAACPHGLPIGELTERAQRLLGS